MNKGGLIGDEIQQRTAKAAKKWIEILERISATVQILAQQNFSFEVVVNYWFTYQSRKSYTMFDLLIRVHWDTIFGKAWLLSQFSSDIKNEITHEIIRLLTARVGQTCISSIQKAK